MGFSFIQWTEHSDGSVSLSRWQLLVCFLFFVVPEFILPILDDNSVLRASLGIVELSDTTFVLIVGVSFVVAVILWILWINPTAIHSKDKILEDACDQSNKMIIEDTKKFMEKYIQVRASALEKYWLLKKHTWALTFTQIFERDFRALLLLEKNGLVTFENKLAGPLYEKTDFDLIGDEVYIIKNRFDREDVFYEPFKAGKIGVRGFEIGYFIAHSRGESILTELKKVDRFLYNKLKAESKIEKINNYLSENQEPEY